ncbi:glycosyl hydrolase family 28-related protein [Paracoccus jiaweipingae]|uniref:glycosyl hydrolase family 28-related protein n=1 Tax=unclassified Paracoccus (in: a-proteobacteria) TaxID=2688777 RepID=UPI0037B46473
MNIAITDGVLLSPPDFSAGLKVWSRQDGTPGSATWHGAANAAIVPADQDFGTCLEIAKTDSVTRLRFMGETPLLPGCYLRVSARVKMVAGTLCSARIAAFAGNGARQPVPGVVTTGTQVALPGYGKVVEVSAIVGTGARKGVDLSWGSQAVYGHFGLDLTGANGGSVRIESVKIEDITAAFLPGRLDWVDVRDFGAVGDGVTDCHAAFMAADAAANGGGVMVPRGEYRIGQSLSMNNAVRFAGQLKMPREARLALLKSFDFPTYADAFGDETEGLKRALQALFGYTDHTTLDLCGRRVELTEPLDMAALSPGLSSFSNRRVIANGSINVIDGPAWATGTATSQGSYDPAAPRQLSNVANIANIEIGARVTGVGVGREVYVNGKNMAAKTLSLSQPLHGGAGTRIYGFERYRYAFDFSGVPQMDRVNFADLDIKLNGVASGIMLPVAGSMFHIRDCYIGAPKDRGITSIGRGCQDLLVDRCQFLSNEMQDLAQNRRSIAININANDSKIRNNRFVRFGAFLVVTGTGHMIEGNHWFQGDGAKPAVRGAGLILAGRNMMTTITGNYVDNNFIEWTNEYDADPDFGNQYSFGGLIITGNTFLVHNVGPDFAWLVVKPYGRGHHIHGLSVTSNVFRAEYVKIDRIDRVDRSVADLDYSRMRNIQFEANMFNGVRTYVANPLMMTVQQATAQRNWLVQTEGALPFGGWTQKVESVVAEAPLLNGAGARVADFPVISTRQGADKRALQVGWTQPVQGQLALRVRMDSPD